MAVAVVLVTALASLVTYLAYVYCTSPLRGFPIANWSVAFSNIWRLLDTYSGAAHITQVKLHERYGPVVRMGPSIVSLADPTVVSEVFRTRDPWKKTEFYSVNDAMVQGQIISNVFSTRDEDWHTMVNRPLKGLFSMTKTLDGEAHIDANIDSLLRAINERFVNTRKSCDISEWVTYFAWDSINSQTVSRPYGMLEAGKDLGGLVEISSKALRYFATITQIPALDHWLDKNPYKRIGPPAFDYATSEAIRALGERLNNPSIDTARAPDLLDKFLDAKQNNPDTVDDMTVVGYMLVSIIAGADTTAAYINAAIYYLLKHPEVVLKLRAELDPIDLAPKSPMTWKETQGMPYLEAVMQEAMRMHPSVALMMERIVPAEGFKLPSGNFLPPGTIVGINPWVMARNKDVYGENVHDFVPERWLQYSPESNEVYQTRLRKMKNADVSFGVGKRACLGKNIGICTAYKVIATLFRDYEITLVDPSKDWKVRNAWFMYCTEINVHIAKRI